MKNLKLPSHHRSKSQQLGGSCSGIHPGGAAPDIKVKLWKKCCYPSNCMAVFVEKKGKKKKKNRSFCCQSTACVDLRQFVSSDLSLQSASPSHFQFMWTHSPLPHWNSPAGQRGFLGSVLRLQRSMDSSDLSLQSGSPSQLHSVGMHSESLQRNSCWPQVGAEHFSSSLPSPQSSSLSHTKMGATHFLLRHWKSLEGQALPSTRGGRTDGSCLNASWRSDRGGQQQHIKTLKTT